MVRGLQEKAARALPAEHVTHVGGWWLRHSTSCAWWVRTVLPHADAGPEELVRRVVGAERFYAGHGAAARFQISPRACPEGLDMLLADRGYRRESAMSLQVAATTQVMERRPRDPLRVRLDDDPTRAWFEVWHAVHGHGGDGRTEWDMLDRAERPSADDRQIRDEILGLLKERSDASTQFVSVIVVAGTVYLWGTAESEQDRTAIRVAAENVAGVKAVRDFLGCLPEALKGAW